MAIESEWINEFFLNNEDFYTEQDDKGNVTYIDGHLSPVALTIFLNNKISEHYSILE